MTTWIVEYRTILMIDPPLDPVVSLGSGQGTFSIDFHSLKKTVKAHQQQHENCFYQLTCRMVFCTFLSVLVLWVPAREIEVHYCLCSMKGKRVGCQPAIPTTTTLGTVFSNMLLQIECQINSDSNLQQPSFNAMDDNCCCAQSPPVQKTNGILMRCFQRGRVSQGC